MPLSINSDALLGVGQGLGGLGLGVYGFFRFTRWIVEFTAGRLDRRSSALDAREQAIEEKFNSRLRHVEFELEQYRMATMRLVTRMAEVMPQDPVLTDVANILRKAYVEPVEVGPTPQDMLETLRGITN